MFRPFLARAQFKLRMPQAMPQCLRSESSGELQRASRSSNELQGASGISGELGSGPLALLMLLEGR
eukprot:7444808-Alexandrium_andersonii.AAC.1